VTNTYRVIWEAPPMPEGGKGPHARTVTTGE
jgi:hypothetical protein